MSSDERNAPADRKLTTAGIGLWGTFLCPVCGGKRAMLGRKLVKVFGFKQWICATCSKETTK